MNQLISALRAARNSDGALTLDRLQMTALLYLLQDLANGEDPKYAILDFLGALPTPESDGRSA